MSKKIEGKVAKIVDDRTVVINRGSKDGVSENMTFAIVARGDEVTDPDSGESLGAWEVVKGQVKVTHVQEKLSVCSAFREAVQEETNPKTGKTLSGAMVDVSFPREEDAKLDVQASDVSGRPQVGPIAVGDVVRSVE